jgi:hypothetical protein
MNFISFMNLANVLYYLRENAIKNDLNLADKFLNIEPPEVSQEYSFDEFAEGYQLKEIESTRCWGINLFAKREKMFYEDFSRGVKKFMQYTQADFLLKEYSITSLEEWEVDSETNIILSENKVYDLQEKPYDWSETMN